MQPLCRSGDGAGTCVRTRRPLLAEQSSTHNVPITSVIAIAASSRLMVAGSALSGWML